MLVDLMRNDLTRVARPGTINVDRFDVEAYANVQHLVGHISAHLDDRETALRRFKRCFREAPSRVARARWCVRSSTSWRKCPVLLDGFHRLYRRSFRKVVMEHSHPYAGSSQGGEQMACIGRCWWRHHHRFATKERG